MTASVERVSAGLKAACPRRSDRRASNSASVVAASVAGSVQRSASVAWLDEALGTACANTRLGANMAHAKAPRPVCDLTPGEYHTSSAF